MKSHIYNTDFYSMESQFPLRYQMRPTMAFSDAMLKTIDENEIVVGDPSAFDRFNDFEEFDLGWDLEG
jgi:hypothetical protein